MFLSKLLPITHHPAIIHARRHKYHLLKALYDMVITIQIFCGVIHIHKKEEHDGTIECNTSACDSLWSLLLLGIWSFILYTLHSSTYYFVSRGQQRKKHEPQCCACWYVSYRGIHINHVNAYVAKGVPFPEAEAKRKQTFGILNLLIPTYVGDTSHFELG